MIRLALLTPNADPTLDLGQELAAYASTLRSEALEVELLHAIIEVGPTRIETEADVLAAALMVVRRARSLAAAGMDAIVIDCMSEPGLAEAQRAVHIPVVGPRSAVLTAAGGDLVAFVSDEAMARDAVARGARVLAPASTGLFGLAASLAKLGVPVLDPLPIAFREALIRVQHRLDGPS